MTREEAIAELQEDKALYETDICHADDGTPDGRLIKALDMAIEALNREQQIIENGYTGKEMRIRIGGRLFAVRELAQ